MKKFLALFIIIGSIATVKTTDAEEINLAMLPCYSNQEIFKRISPMKEYLEKKTWYNG